MRMLDIDHANGSELPHAIEQIRKQSERAGAIIRGAGRFVRPGPTERRPESVDELLNSGLELAQLELRRASVKPSLQLPKRLPNVLVNQVEIQQVLLNLIVNAVEAMEDTPASKRRVVLDAGLAEDGKVEVSVRDAGPGINGALKQKIFDTFFTTRGGLGMGLAVSRTIVETHGGQLWCEDADNGGALFRFTLPPDPEEARHV